MDTPANQIPGFSYDAGTMNVGESYAKGMAAGSQVGEQIGKGITQAADTLTQNRYADDTLSALKQTGVLSPDAYNAVAGKSLGAKQSILGMYATQWINDQAQTRELQKIGYTSAADVARQQAIQHNAILEAYQAISKGYPAAANVDPKKILAQPNQGGGGGGGGGQGQAAAPIFGPNGPIASPAGVTPAIQQQALQLSGTPTAPTPLGSADITSPGPKLGMPIGRNAQVAPGSTLVLGKGPNGEQQHFVRYPDGTLRPIQG